MHQSLCTTPNPSVLRMPSGETFLRAFVRGLRARFDHLEHCHIVMPTQRSCIALRDMLIKDGAGITAMLLPRITALGQLDSWLSMEHAKYSDRQLPRVLGDCERHTLLSERLRPLIQKTVSHKTGFGEAQVHRMTRSFMRLLDVGFQHKVDWRLLSTLVPHHLASHWQESLEILTHLTQDWPKFLEQRGLIEREALHNHLMTWFNEQLYSGAQGLLMGPMIVAGSTGSIARTADLMAALVTSQQGMVVFPAMDDALIGQESVTSLPPHHPYAVVFRNLHRLGLQHSKVPLWTLPSPEISADSKNATWMHALLPQSSQAVQGQGIGKSQHDAVSHSLQLLTFANQREEAQIIALVIREKWEAPSHEKTAVICPDDGLLAAIQAELVSWGIHLQRPLPLAQTPMGVLSQLCLAMLLQQDDTTLLSLLKHPLWGWAAAGETSEFNIYNYERQVLRRQDGIRTPLSAFDKLPQSALKTFLRTQFALSLSNHQQTCSAWAHWHKNTLLAVVGRHAERGLDLVQGASELLTILESLMLLKDDRRITAQSYADLVQSLAGGRSDQPPYDVHARVALLNPREARLLNFDHIIIAGMNEGTWPASSPDNPWLSSGMMRTLGLPTAPELAGLAAYDILQWAGIARTITLTRAVSHNSRPSTPSRWWWRLQNWLPLAQENLAYYRHLAHLKLTQNRGDEAILPKQLNIWPCPPKALRPRRFSVTALEELARNPYGYYARAILDLRPLDSLQGDARALGRLTHKMLEWWMQLALGSSAEVLRTELFEEAKIWSILRTKLGLSQKNSSAQAWFTEQRLRRTLHSFLRQTKPIFHQIHQSWTEIAGEIVLNDASGEPFYLFAKADRLDAMQDGSFMLYDYKTGQLPSRKAVMNGEALQLALEGLIFEKGGYAEAMKTSQCPTHGVISAIHYWQLQGMGRPSARISLEGEALTAAKSAAMRRIQELVARFATAPYDFVDDGFTGPVAHLARVFSDVHSDATDG